MSGETVLSVLLGVGLAAACGFRVFLPLLAMSALSLGGHLSLSPGFSWIGTYPAAVAFATAAGIEAFAYFIPGLDHLLDGVSTPAAVLAGTLAAASSMVDLDPFLKWTLALIAGGGAAGIIQGGTVLLRAQAALATGGMGNFIVAALELAGAALLSALAVLLPVLAAAVAAAACVLMVRKTGRAFFRRRPGR